MVHEENLGDQEGDRVRVDEGTSGGDLQNELDKKGKDIMGRLGAEYDRLVKELHHDHGVGGHDEFLPSRPLEDWGRFVDRIYPKP